MWFALLSTFVVINPKYTVVEFSQKITAIINWNYQLKLKLMLDIIFM